MKTWIFSIGLLAAAPTFAQHAHHASATDAEPEMQRPAVYSGMQERAIKGLSEQQLVDLRAGKGMSLALPAELNGYPGPAHTLELSAPLGLTEHQERQARELFAAMHAEAKALGEQVISSERALDQLFKEKKADYESVQQAAANAARAQGELRTAHLKYHLKMRDMLNAEQIAKYSALRGYE